MSFTQALLAGGTAFSIMGQLNQGRQSQQIYQYNAALSKQKAELIGEAGKITSARLRRQKKTFAAKQTAGFAKAGVKGNTPLLVTADSAAELELDIMLNDFETRIGIINAYASAELDEMRGRQIRTSSYMSAGSTLLTQIPNFVNAA